MKNSLGDTGARNGEARRRSRCGQDDTDAAERTGLMEASSSSDDSGAGTQLGALLDRVRVRIEAGSTSSARLVDEEDSLSGPSSTAGSPRSPSSPVPNEGTPRVMPPSPTSSSSSPALQMVATASEDLISRIQENDDVKVYSSNSRSLSTAFRLAFGRSSGPGSKSASPVFPSSKRQSPEHHAIPMEEPRAFPASSADEDETNVSAAARDDLSVRSMCGPNPRTIAIGVAVVLSIWAVAILGAHVYKKVYKMEDDLASMYKKMEDLQTKYNFAQENSAREISRLHERLHLVHEQSSKRDVSFEEEEEGSRVRRRNASEFTPKKNIKPVLSDNNQAAKAATCTSDGQKCVFPFFYNGQNRTDCVREWYQPRSWCAVRVDSNGHHIKADSSSWGYCADECPSV